MRRIRDRVAGLDVHRDSVTACAQLREPGEEEPTVEKAKFATTARGVADLAEWLAVREVATVAMESTGVYWKPVFYRIEGLFEEVWLVNAQHVKNVPGRKTDMADAEWLADVVAHGMVRASFVPPPEIRQLRELTRYRKTLVDERAREVQRLDKVLQDAGIKLTSVASKLMTKSGRKMIEALISGETHPEVLAELAEGKMRPKIPALIDAMEHVRTASRSDVPPDPRPRRLPRCFDQSTLLGGGRPDEPLSSRHRPPRDHTGCVPAHRRSDRR